MSTNTFENFYGVDLDDPQDLSSVTQAIAAENGESYVWCPYCGDFAYTDASGNSYYRGDFIPAAWDNGRGFGQQGQRCTTCGWNWNLSVDVEGTLGWVNFSGALKNGLGVTVRHNAKVLGQTGASTVTGGRSYTNGSQNFTRYVDEYGAAYYVGLDYKRTYDIGLDGKSTIGDTREFSIGALGIFGISMSFNVDRNGSWSAKDLSIGLDGGLSAALFLGGNLNIKIGGLYVFGQ